MAVHILGIRHHGVGSAQQVLKRLEELKPDIVLVEGPPEINEMLSLIGKEGMVPPVALMLYNIDVPKESVFYPFAEYSPEWVASKYANKNGIPVKALDLPANLSFNLKNIEREKQVNPANEKPEENRVDELVKENTDESEINEDISVKIKNISSDPLDEFAKIDGFENGEAWWDYYFEQNYSSSSEHFEAVMLTMQTLRDSKVKSLLDKENVSREAYMRQIIRQTQNEIYENIAVICGAWHGPALTDLKSSSKEDTKIIKSIPKSKIKIASTWIPWTNSRLSMFSGYGAGIYSPGWYEHLWETEDKKEITWLSKVSDTFRAADMDISTAHIIEAYKLSVSLASIRNKSLVGLSELNESVLAVMCMGDHILLELIKEELIVGNKLGEVPADIPKVPLQENFEQTIKKLRLKLLPTEKNYILDLRKPTDLQKSILFHRLTILGISWAHSTSIRTKGTFKESWVAYWKPEIMVEIIDKAYFGNTIEAASQTVVLNKCTETLLISDVADLIELSIPAELFSSIEKLLDRINELSAISADIVDLMKALPQLINVSRYGDVRKSDLSVLNNIVEQLLIKIFVGLPNGCYGLDEENSNQMFGLIAEINHSIRIFEKEEILEEWHQTLLKLNDNEGVHPIIRGCVCRLLLDASILTDSAADAHISMALSIANDPWNVAAWVEGFLRGNAMILIYDNKIWNLLYDWISSIENPVFMELLPMLRRAFSKFEFADRRQIGEKAKRGLVKEEYSSEENEFENFDMERAVVALSTIKKLMGTLSADT